MAKLKLTADEAIAEIKKVIAQMKQLKKQAAATGPTIKTLETRLNNLKAKTTATNAAMRGLKAQLRTNKANVRALNAEVKKLTKSQQKNQAATKKSSSTFSSFSKAIGALVAAQLVLRFAKQVFELAKTFDSLNLALDTTSKNMQQAESSQRFLMKLTKDFGVELIATTNRFIKFSTAARLSGLSMKDTEKIFRSMTKAGAVLGLQTDELTGIYLALEQMLSKGKVTTEELRRQLGERLPGALSIMAASMGVTTAKLDEMLKKGEVISAEVLPKFAEAVELAYGIDTVETVDTLTAAQGRLTTAWQNFVRVVLDDESALATAYKNITGVLTGAVNNVTYALGGDDNKIQTQAAGFEEDYGRSQEAQARSIVNAKARQGEMLFQLQEKLDKNKLAQLEETNDDELKKLEQQGADITTKIIAFNDAVEAELRRGAKMQVGFAKETLEEAKLAYEASLLPIGTGMVESNARTGQGKEGDIFMTSDEKTKRLLDYAEAIAKYNVHVKNAEKSKPVPIEPTPGGGSKRPDTSDLDLAIARLKKAAEIQKILTTDESLSYEERLAAANNYYTFLGEIEKVTQDKSVRLAQGNKNKIEKAEIDKRAALIKINEDGNKAIKELTSSFIQEELLQIQAANKAELDQEIIDIKAKYAAMGEATVESQALMEEEINEAKRQSSNKSLEEQATSIKNFLDLLGLEGEERIKLERAILDLLAQMRDKDAEDKKKTFEDDMEMLKDFLNQAFALADAFLERKIENINAEIDAETKKYDKLIALAEGDAKQQQALEEEKQAKLEQLEAKRLKAEQRRAKYQKAQALVEIAINTAIAVSKVLGQTGIFGIPASIPIIALGALQAATVLAQPIPQYKKGLEKASHDHIGMINDGGKQEFLERDGAIYTTTKKDALVGIKTGDTIYKDYDDMVEKSLLLSAISNGAALTEQDHDALLVGITESIDKGFKKAKINNVLNVNQEKPNWYKNEKSRWN